MATTVEIASVQRSHLTEQVIERIKGYILANNLPPGAKLPGERDLAKALGVSRNVTRESISALQATGILDVQPGNGVFVSDFDFETLASHVGFAVRRQPHHFKHLLEARITFELGNLELISRRIQARDCERLEQSIRRMEQAEDAAEDVAADLEFHRRLVEITGNPILMEFTSCITQFFVETHSLAGPPAGEGTTRREMIEDHRRIVRALAAGDVQAARTILGDSIRGWNGGGENSIDD